MTTKSQAAFEQHYLGYHNMIEEDFSKTDGLYNMTYIHRDYEKWQAAEAYGRKQALEECLVLCQEQYRRGGFRQNFEIQDAIKELLK